MIGRLSNALNVHGVFGVLGLLAQRIVPSRLSRHKQLLKLFRDHVGLEIGGPSPVFGPQGLLPVYPVAGRLDNCNFGARTMWEGDIEEGATFRYHPGRAPGRQYVAEATDLRQLASEAYDFVLSSHALEHSANPLLALAEWVRVLNAGGVLALVLPHKDATFDHRRPVTTLAHMIEDLDRRTTEADLTHLDEILRLHDLTRDVAAGDFEAFKARSLRNLENRGLHHHVFDTALAVAMVEHMGLEVLHVEARRPMDIVVIARKPVVGAVRDPPPRWRSPFPSDRPAEHLSRGLIGEVRSGLPPHHLRVAVLVATFDGEAFLAAQLDSLAAQEGIEVQVFARDDGSTDGTLAILEKYAGRWPGLAAPSGGARLGPAASFLDLLAKVPDGFDGYAFCDQDDVWLPDKLQRAMQRLNDGAEGGPRLYCSRVLCVDQNLKSPIPARIDADGRFEHLLFENIAYGNTVVINAAARSLIIEHAPPAGIIMHDWWCALVVAAFGTVGYDERPGVLYRQHHGNQVGAAPSRWAEITRHLAMLWRDPRRFYPIHAQAAAFLRLYGDRISPPRRGLVESLVASRGSLAARMVFALSGQVVRSRRLDALASRMLILAGWY